MDRRLRSTFARLVEAAAERKLAAPGAQDATQDCATFHEAFETLLGARQRAKDPLGCSAVELLVLAGEAAVALHEFGLASAACDAFFLQGAPEDQFFVRALFVRALVVADAAAPLNGAAAVAQLGLAIGHLLRAVEIVMDPERRARYGFLVYNASVHFYAIARPMMRSGARKHYVAPL